MTRQSEENLAKAATGDAAEVVNPDGKAAILLVCEHASNYIPDIYGNLGLTADVLQSHVAWDPGALAVAKRLSRALDAPLVAARISRLVHDCNRPPDAADAMPEKSEQFVIPGNAGLSQEQRAARCAAVYEPFHRCLGEMLSTRSHWTALVTVHSFVPVYNGHPRAVQVGLVHDEDDRLAQAMLPGLRARSGLRVELNQPYGPRDGVTHILRRHGIANRISTVMIEIRSDLIDGPKGQDRMAEDLCHALALGLGEDGASLGRRARS